MEIGDLAFAEENGLCHVISSTGRHETSIDLNTGVILRTFGYNEDNQLISVTDQFGNKTLIQRGTDGMPSAIMSPDGLDHNVDHRRRQPPHNCGIPGRQRLSVRIYD